MHHTNKLFTNTQRINDDNRIFVALQPYKTCDAFLAQQDKLKDSFSEKKKFERSKTFKMVIKQVSKRLGFTEDHLKKKQIIDMFDMCRYEQAWDLNVTSIWCSVS